MFCLRLFTFSILLHVRESKQKIVCVVREPDHISDSVRTARNVYDVEKEKNNLTYVKKYNRDTLPISSPLTKHYYY